MTKYSIKINHLSFIHQNNDSIILKVENTNLVGPNLIAIIGESGIGKSTLLKLINENIGDNLDIQINGKCVYLPQDLEFIGRTPREFFEIIGCPEWHWRQCYDIFNLNFINEKKNGFDEPVLLNKQFFSGGELQRLFLCAVTGVDSQIILLDEPTSALDISLKESVIKYLKNLSIDKLIICATHDRGLIRECNQVYEVIYDEKRKLKTLIHKGNNK